MSPHNLPIVLLVEDSPDDIDFARRALAKSGVAHTLVVADEGETALRWLAHGNGSSQPLRPALVLLDLNLPGISGLELLGRIKSHRQWSLMPVVILSTSSHATDIEECYRAHANSYHSKSADLAAYQNIVRQIVEYWLGAVVPSPLAELRAGDCPMAAVLT